MRLQKLLRGACLVLYSPFPSPPGFQIKDFTEFHAVFLTEHLVEFFHFCGHMKLPPPTASFVSLDCPRLFPSHRYRPQFLLAIGEPPPGSILWINWANSVFLRKTFSFRNGLEQMTLVTTCNLGSLCRVSSQLIWVNQRSLNGQRPFAELLSESVVRISLD